jgi:phage protein D
MKVGQALVISKLGLDCVEELVDPQVGAVVELLTGWAGQLSQKF